jgi:hypothetical protein
MARSMVPSSSARLPPEHSPIRFGTDGWRGRIGEDFTLAGVRRCAAGIASYLHEIGRESSPVVLGFDGRFLPAASRERWRCTSPPSASYRSSVLLPCPPPPFPGESSRRAPRSAS